MSFKLDRRAALQGFAGTIIGLPVLEAMLDVNGAALAQGTVFPKRYLVLFGGGSIGSDDSNDPVYMRPTSTGANYSTRDGGTNNTQAGDVLGLKALESNFGYQFGPIKNYVTVVSGLAIPTSGAGSTVNHFHTMHMPPMLAGVSRPQSDMTGGDLDWSKAFRGPTSDVLVHRDAGVNGGRPLIRTRVQVNPGQGTSSGGPKSRISFEDNLSGPSPETSLRAFFDLVFPTGVTVPDPGNPPDPTVDARAYYLWQKRHSILDFVSQRYQRVMNYELSRGDKQRLQQHFDEIRDLENRVAAIEPGAGDAGGDPGGGTTGEGCMDLGVNMSFASGANEYENEAERMPEWYKLIRMAYVCDQARVGSHMLLFAQCFLDMNPVLGLPSNFHELGHSNTGSSGPTRTRNVGLSMAWLMREFGQFVADLQATPEGAGTLLDNCAMVMMFEGGHGTGLGGEDGTGHSVQDMVALVAGGAGGLKQGHHIETGGEHPAKVLTTLMNAVGHRTTQLGEVAGTLGSLLV